MIMTYSNYFIEPELTNSFFTEKDGSFEWVRLNFIDTKVWQKTEV